MPARVFRASAMTGDSQRIRSKRDLARAPISLQSESLRKRSINQIQTQMTDSEFTSPAPWSLRAQHTTSGRRDFGRPIPHDLSKFAIFSCGLRFCARFAEESWHETQCGGQQPTWAPPAMAAFVQFPTKRCRSHRRHARSFGSSGHRHSAMRGRDRRCGSSHQGPIPKRSAARTHSCWGRGRFLPRGHETNARPVGPLPIKSS